MVPSLSMEMAGVWVMGMSKESVAAGASSEKAVTSLDRLPLPAVGEPLASSSAWVKVCDAEHVTVSPGDKTPGPVAASELAAQSQVSPEALSSDTPTLCNV